METAPLLHSADSSGLLVFQHARWEGPGLIADLARDRGLAMTVVAVWDGAPIPDPSSQLATAGLIVMGGPMGALDDDQYPNLRREREYIRAAIDQDIPVLGVCLGHQLLAVSLGATLLPGVTEEIGVGFVERGDGADAMDGGSNSTQLLNGPVLHWHRDAVSPPAGCTVLATSGGGSVLQAFRLGSGLGLQFHLEVTPNQFAQWLGEPQMLDDLPAGLGADELLADFTSHFAEMKSTAAQLVGTFLDDVAARERGNQNEAG